MLKALAWMRERAGPMAVYRLLPSALRARVSAALSRVEARSLRFRKSAEWKRRADVATGCSSASGIGPQPQPASGVNIYAYVRGRFGLAESARQYTRALLIAGFPVWLRDVGEGLGLAHDMEDRSLEGVIGQGERHDVNLVFVNPDYLDAVLQRNGLGPGAGKGYTMASWFWEAESFPAEWLPALEMVDEVMVASVHLENALRKVTDKPVLRVPLPVDSLPDSGLTRRDFGLSESAFVFLNTFDFDSYPERKNPLAVIEAFRMAFPDVARGVQLLIKSSNGHRHPDALRMLRESAARDDRILIRDEIIEKCHVHALQRCVDSFVSLHRAEGFGMALAESMWHGKPVVATGWSGNMEFMNSQNSCLVRYRLVDVRPSEYAHSRGQRWAEPDIAHAADLMRQLVADPDLARQLGEQARRDVAAQLSAGTAAKKIMDRVQLLASSRKQVLAAGPSVTAE